MQEHNSYKSNIFLLKKEKYIILVDHMSFSNQRKKNSLINHDEYKEKGNNMDE